MQRQKTENAGRDFANPPTPRTSDAQIAPKKSAQPKNGTLHRYLTRNTCPTKKG